MVILDRSGLSSEVGCWGLYSVGYCSLSVVHTWPLQVGPGDRRLDKFGTWCIIKEKGSSQIGAALLRSGASVDGDKPCNTSTITDFPVLITQEVSLTCLFDE